MTRSRTVIVTDGEERPALAAVRSLGAAGYRVIVVASRAPVLAGVSRFADLTVPLTSPAGEPARYLEEMTRLVRLADAGMVLPVTEAAALALLGGAAALAPAVIPMGDLEHFRLASDKARVLAEAAGLGIAAPRQTVVTAAGRREARELRFPVVVKTTRSVVESGGARRKFGVTYAADQAALDRCLAALPEPAYPVLVQERVVGQGIGVFLLRWHGRTYARFCHARLREKPPAGGVSVYRESVPPDLGLIEVSETLVDRLGWNGVAMVEYKRDRAGTPHLMEINARLWGSLQLAIDAGVDFPRLLAELAFGGSPTPVLHWRVGIRSRWWWGDVDQLLLRLFRSRARLALPEDSPSRFEALADFVRIGDPSERLEIERWSDPRPGVRAMMDWFAKR